MSRCAWHILRDGDGDAVTVTRVQPVRWDVAAETRLPDARPLRVAHQVRQDVWRALRRQRGFAPAVEVRRSASGLLVRAGGRISAPHDAKRLIDRLRDVLDDPPRRARWIACARAGRGPALGTGAGA